VKKEVEGFPALSCAECGGIWLDKGELNELLHPNGWDVEYCSTEHPEEDPTTGSECPSCGANLKRGDFVEYSDIPIDYCPDCGGIWLGKGELREINRELETLRHTPDSWQHKLMVFLAKLPF
jgi:Zn-finger nucleic acid-binding protein